MFETVKGAFSTKDIRSRIFYTFIMLIVIRLGSQIPIPGIDRNFFGQFFAANSGGTFSFLNAFTGGSFEHMSIFALSISPYITSSIIIQLLTIAIPKLEELQKEGEEGRKLLASYTRYTTVILSVIQSSATAIGFGRQGLIPNYNAFSVVQMVIIATAGSTLLMWIGERITEKGVGNGISMVLLINILSRIPHDLYQLSNQFIVGKTIAMSIGALLIIVAVILATTVLVVLLNGAQRNIPVQYAKKVQGRKQIGGQASNIPLKVNTAGVIPVIFASSLMSLPLIIVAFMGNGNTNNWVVNMLNQSNWFKLNNPSYSVGVLVYIFLLIFFAYFYTSLTFNPIEVADNIKKQGGFVPGIRPGKPTSDYLQKILGYIIFIGAVGLIIVAMIPIIFSGLFDAHVSFGGTSLIIIVGVILETNTQIQAKLNVRNYKGFLHH